MSEPTPAPAAPAAPPAPAAGDFPGKTLGIVGLVLAFLFSLAGLIVSIIARGQSKAAGVKNTPATVGLVLSIIFLVFQIIWIVVLIIGAVTAATLGGAYLQEICAQLGTGVWEVDGVTYTCG